MNSVQIEENVKILLQDFLSHKVSRDDFVYELLLSYGHRKSVVSRVKTGERNLSKVAGEVILKRHLYFKPCTSNLFSEIDNLKKSKTVTSNKIRFVIVTDFNQLIAVDTKTQDTLDIELNKLPNNFDFFLPWAGTEKMVYRGENPADVKAAEKMADLFDLIKELNYPANAEKEQLHELVVFLNRLLFCFFAEDTKIFLQNQFTNLISLHTQEDGSDLNTSLERLFEVLNTSAHHRSNLPQYLQSFPYVNGGLFSKEVNVPTFNAKARRMLLDSGTLDWSDINPDIFGSMIQGVADANTRSKMGMHYTSVTNIMKVIEPLFLNDFYDDFDKCKGNINKLKKLQVRLSRIKIFDPACGSGNFLIIAYKEIRQLEIEILKRIQELEQISPSGMMGLFDESHSAIRLDQFYGIELDDFAHEIAVLSLWLVEHQMNMIFETEFGYTAPTLPLKQSGRIVAGNATRIDWNSICPSSENDEVYLLGNPPYKGSRVQSPEQKEDMGHAFKGFKVFKDIDYVGCWFIKAAQYIQGNMKVAFVTTNSLCQGSQVTALWPYIYSYDLEIFFAYKSFVWHNNAKDSAKVTCSIIGIRKSSNSTALLYEDTQKTIVKNINAYLIPSSNIFVQKRRNPLSNIPIMLAGNYTGHAQKLMLSDSEKNELLASSKDSAKYLKKVIGSNELIKGISRWCLWISDFERSNAENISGIKERIDGVAESRANSRDKEANKLVGRPHQFRDLNETKIQSIVVPTVSSEKREYLPIGFIDSDTIVTNKAMVLYDQELYIFSLLISKMHMVWVRAVAGRLETRISYSSVLCYNTFPVPDLTELDKECLTDLAIGVIGAREEFPHKSLSDLYNPNKMPVSLLQAHEKINEYVDHLYSSSNFADDSARLESLFKRYEIMAGDK
jgi:hypothetical protein